MLPFEQKENTEALQDRHKEIYERFFAENDLVVSCDTSFALPTGIAWRSGAPTIRQKLPFRTYIGIQPNQVGKIQINHLLGYSPHKQRFIPLEYDPYDWAKCLPLLEKIVKNKTGQNEIQGITINVLAEKPADTGLDPGISNAIMFAVYAYYKFATINEIEQVPYLTGHQINYGTDPISLLYKEIQGNIIKFVALTFCGVSSGSTSYTSTLNSSFPIVHFTEERAGSIEHPFPGLPPLDVSSNVDELNHMRAWCYRLNELADINGEFPFDVVGINPGTTKNYGAPSEYVKNVVIPGFDELQENVKQIFAEIISEEQDHLPNFLKKIERSGRYWVQFAQGQSISRVFLLASLIRAYMYRLKSSEITNFLEILETTLSSNGPFEETPSRNLRFIFSKVRQKAHEQGVKIGLRAMYWGKEDGTVFVFSQRGRFRDQIHEVVKEIQSVHDPKVKIEFASWRDGWGSQGIKVDQFISQGRYSTFIDQNDKQLISCDALGRCRSTIVQNNEMNRNGFDLFLDKVNGKISIRGQEFSSKEIPSQKATIEILECLMQNLGKTVSNKDLPKSGYTEYRNELQGKIITPLNRLLKEQISQELDLKINGQLMNFDINFAPNGLTVGILDRIK